MTGRGAQLINMIRNKKTENLNNNGVTTLSSSAELNNTNASNMSCSNENNEQKDKELLIFSKRVPSPTASPSASILKRKLHDITESLVDSTISANFGSVSSNSTVNALLSPALSITQSSALSTLERKRKRVSFHDPPVSLTKKYLLDSDESKLKSKRLVLIRNWIPFLVNKL